MIRCGSLTVRYGSFAALENLSLEVEAGEIALLTGPSGCGKSTALRALAGILPENAEVEGTAQIDGHAGFVPQNPVHALFCATVFEEVSVGRASMPSTTPKDAPDRPSEP